MKKKIDIEYILNSSPKVLYSRLSTPGGLSEWFADDVHQQGKIFTFIWDGNEHKAELVLKKENRYIRYKWLEMNNNGESGYFEFRINQDELTGDVALLITDFTDDEDEEGTRELWNTQISELKRVIGL